MIVLWADAMILTAGELTQTQACEFFCTHRMNIYKVFKLWMQKSQLAVYDKSVKAYVLRDMHAKSQYFADYGEANHSKAPPARFPLF